MKSTYGGMIKDLSNMVDEYQLQYKKLEESFECSHEQTELRKMVVDGGGIQYKKQCLTCGKSMSNPISKSLIQDIDSVKFFDDSLKSKREILRKSECEKISKNHQERYKNRQTSFWKGYNIYLNTDEWKAKREKVLKRANWICEGCNEKNAVEVHHLTYEHVGFELLFELVALCETCHDLVHSDGEVKNKD